MNATVDRLYRSIFRTGWPRTKQQRLSAMLSSLVLHVHPTRVRVGVLRPSYTLGLGLVSFFLFVILTVTGLALMLYYVPHPAAAYRSMKDLEHAVAFGMFLRNAHRWAAHGMVAVVFLHMCRVFFTGAYKPPREFNWVVGVAAAAAHPRPVLHRLPAAVGPARVLGDHGRDGDRRVLPGARAAGALPPPRRPRDRAGRAPALLRAALPDPAARDGRARRPPLLARAEGRRPQRAGARLPAAGHRVAAPRLPRADRLRRRARGREHASRSSSTRRSRRWPTRRARRTPRRRRGTSSACRSSSTTARSSAASSCRPRSSSRSSCCRTSTRTRAASGVWFARERRVANAVFAAIALALVAVTVVGTFFRGPNWAFVLPWAR